MGDGQRVESATLELDAESNAPHGALTGADGRRRAFFGWTELASAIEDWRTSIGAIADGHVEEA